MYETIIFLLLSVDMGIWFSHFKRITQTAGTKENIWTHERKND